jgi:hypothetical protein
VSAEKPDKDQLEDLPPEDLPPEQDGEQVLHLETDLETDDPTADPDDPATDPAMQAVVEGGGGVAEGFEQSEHELKENAEGEVDGDPLRNPFRGEPEKNGPDEKEFGEPDHVHPDDEY